MRRLFQFALVATLVALSMTLKPSAATPNDVSAERMKAYDPPDTYVAPGVVTWWKLTAAAIVNPSVARNDGTDDEGIHQDTVCHSGPLPDGATSGTTPAETYTYYNDRGGKGTATINDQGDEVDVVAVRYNAKTGERLSSDWDIVYRYFRSEQGCRAAAAINQAKWDAEKTAKAKAEATEQRMLNKYR